MTNQEPISKEKAKYLKRATRQTARNKEEIARRRNASQRPGQLQQETEKRHALITEQGPHKFSYTEKEIEMLDAARAAGGGMPMNALTLMAVLAAQAQHATKKLK